MTKTIIPGDIRSRRRLPFFCLALAIALFIFQRAEARAGDPGPPGQTVKLIFIHHSTGENWLADDNGQLGRKLGENNYFVSDTNYGWGPGGIGDRTDIPNWPEWFNGPKSGRTLKALYSESGKHSPYARSAADPGGENEIVMFKSTTRPDKLFVVITAPPLQDSTHARNARAFNNWLVHDWLSSYGGRNVAVFDFYNVLTDPKNHHRFGNGSVEHVADRGGNTLHYPSNGDDHPSRAGNRKATAEFIPLLNVYYHRWKGGGGAGTSGSR
jgi:hypothetical protein